VWPTWRTPSASFELILFGADENGSRFNIVAAVPQLDRANETELGKRGDTVFQTDFLDDLSIFDAENGGS